MKVGVIIPYKEDRGWLSQAIESVNRQTYKGEIHLSVQQSDNSVGYNLNRGIEDCLENECSLIRYLCEDDMLTHHSIEKSVQFFKENPVHIMHSNAINFYQDKRRPQQLQKPRKTNPTLEDMLEFNVLHGGTVVYRYDCFFGFDSDPLFDESLWTGEEYDFNMRLMSQGCTIGYLDEVTYNYRRHSKQKSLGNTDAKYQAKRKKAIEKIKNRYR